MDNEIPKLKLSNLQSRKLSGQIFNPESFRDKSLKSSNLSNHPSGYVIRINSFNSCLTPNKKATFQKRCLSSER